MNAETSARVDLQVGASRTGVFTAAFLGALLPRVVGLVSNDKAGLQLPGDGDGYKFAGWFLIVLVVALGAGYVAAYIWRERDHPRAFLFGIGFVYLLTGGGADLGKLGPGKAAGQPTSSATAKVGTIEVTLKTKASPSQSVEQDFEIILTEQGASKSATVARTTTFPFVITAPPGYYRVEAGNSLYTGGQWVTVTPGEKVAAAIVLHKKSAWRNFFEGVKRGVTER